MSVPRIAYRGRRHIDLDLFVQDIVSPCQDLVSEAILASCIANWAAFISSGRCAANEWSVAAPFTSYRTSRRKWEGKGADREGEDSEFPLQYCQLSGSEVCWVRHGHMPEDMCIKTRMAAL
eukprot:372331-Rhodomonas_salina.2